METRARYILVGLFTLLALASVVLFTLWMAKASTDRGYTEYEVVFGDPVSGLSVGSPVHFNGIRIGEVNTLVLDPNDASQVRARISVDASTPITADTTARIALLNITGASGIDLQQGTTDKSPLESQNGIPTIVAEPSPFTRLRVSSEELLVNLTTFLNNASRLVSDENTRRVANILENLDQFSGQIVDQSEGIGELLISVQQTSDKLNETLKHIDEDLIVHGQPMIENAAATMQRISDFSERLEQILEQNEASINAGLSSAGDIGPAIQELRNTLSILNAIVTEIDQDPAAYLFSRETIKEFN